MILLDLCCKSGGASMGYHRAGFEVVGVDIEPQKHYPFKFIQGDALTFPLEGYDAYHASPPCQAFTMANYQARRDGKAIHPNLIDPIRQRLIATGKPWVIENVIGAPLINPLLLCGTMFGLGVFRHRLFESNILILAPLHAPHKGKIGDGKYFSVAGGAGRWKSWGTVVRDVNKGSVLEWREAMGIDWMIRKGLTQAIPPAYTEYIGSFLINTIKTAEGHDRKGEP